jgi:hypothetical protein
MLPHLLRTIILIISSYFLAGPPLISYFPSDKNPLSGQPDQAYFEFEKLA